MHPLLAMMPTATRVPAASRLADIAVGKRASAAAIRPAPTPIPRPRSAPGSSERIAASSERYAPAWASNQRS